MKTQAVTLTALLAGAWAASVYQITAGAGSLAGSTRVTVWGAGFERHGADGSTKVFFGNDECITEEYSSDDQKIVCYSPVHDVAEIVNVQVAIVKLNARNLFAECPSRNCRFEYRTDRTPRLSSFPLGGSDGDVIRASGQLYGDNTRQYTIRIGESVCGVDEELHKTPTDMMDGGGNGVVKCRLGPNQAGRYNMTFRVHHATSGYGQARYSQHLYQVNPADDSIYTFTHAPRVESLSFSRSGLVAGHELVISGSGFSWDIAQNNVTLAGVPCRVTYSDGNTIKCIVGSANVDTNVTVVRGVGHPVGRGLLRRMYSGVNDVSNNEISQTALTSQQVEGGSIYNNVEAEFDSYTTDLSGYFIPPVTANYSFFVKGDDRVTLYLSPSRRASEAVLVADGVSWNSIYSWRMHASQISKPIFLTANTPYFFRTRHTDYSSGDAFDVSIRVHADGNAEATALLSGRNQVRYQSVPEIQRIATRLNTIQREIQTITITGAASGTFALIRAGGGGAGGGTITEFPFDASAASLASTARSLTGCNNIAVSRTLVTTADTNSTGYSWAFTMSCPTRVDWPLMTPVSISLRPQLGQQVQLGSKRTQTASECIGGTFALQYNNYTTAPIRFDSSGAAMEAALEALPGLADVEVAGYFDSATEGAYWFVTFWSENGDVSPLLPITAPTDGLFDGATTLTGANATVVVTEALKGSTDPFYYPAPMDWFFTSLPVPGVHITSNGIAAECDVFKFVANDTRPACAFAFDSSITPAVTGVSATTVTVGDELIISGVNFLPDSAGVGMGPGGTDIPVWLLNKVYLNDSLCNVTAATATQLTCKVSHSAYGSYAIKVEVGMGRGFAAIDAAVPALNYPMILYTVAPLRGSKAGGTVLTLTGTGFRAFDAGNTITIAGEACNVESSSFSEVRCRTPATATAGATVSAAIVANGVTFGSSYVYNATLTPTVIDISPRKLPSGITGTVNITLTGLPPALSVIVKFGHRSCRVQRVIRGPQSVVECVLVRGAPKPFPQTPDVPVVYVENLGYAAGAIGLDTAFGVLSMNTQVGSLQGGSEIIFFGTGFSQQQWQNEALFVHSDPFGYTYRHPLSFMSVAADGSNITFQLPFIPFLHRGIPKRATPNDSVTGVIWIKVNNITAPCASGLDDCSFTQRIEDTPIIRNFTVDAEPASPSGVALVMVGSSLPVPGMHVMFGDNYSCRPIFAVNGTVRCHIPVGIAGTYALSAHVHTLGAARFTGEYTFPFIVDDRAPLVGSIAGGMEVVFTGAGFADDVLERNVVLFGTAPAQIVSATNTRLVVRAPPRPLANTAVYNVTVMVLDAMITEQVAQVVLPFLFTYHAGLDYTPIVSSISPVSGYAGSLVVIRGTGLGNGTTDVEVRIGGEPCHLYESNATHILCSVGAAPAGLHRVLVRIAGKGLAQATAVTFRSLLEVASISSSSSSFNGGAIMVITGRGFAASNAGSVAVKTCNTECTVVSANYSSITCRTNAALTSESLRLYNAYTEGMLMGTITPASAAAAHDMNVETTFTSCTVTFDLGMHTRGAVTSVRYYPKFRSTTVMAGGRFIASTDGVTWNTLYTVPSPVLEGWNDASVANGTSPGDLPTYRYLRFVFATQVGCVGAEVEFRGFPVLSAPNGICRPNVTVDAVDTPKMFTGVVAAVTGAGPADLFVQYSPSATAYITGISPNNGTALGGTLVTLTGSNFVAAVDAVSAAFNGVPCSVVTASESTIQCVTGKRDVINPISVDVTFTSAAGANGRAVYDIATTNFRYLDKWSSLTTWKYQEPPVEGDTVVIPEGQAVLLDISPPPLFLLLVQGELIIDRRDLTLDATYVFVHGGRFEVGTERQPFLNKFTLTLHGDRYTTIEIPEVGAKCLAVMDRGGMAGHGEGGHTHTADAGTFGTRAFSQGALELHGAPRKRVWTTLAVSAAAGSKTLRLSEDVDWAAGEKLFVTQPGDMGSIEEVIVDTLVDSRTVMLREPLQNNHDSSIFPAQQYGHADIDMRAEVGLLSRNVRIRGDDNSPRQLYGVHVGVFHGGVMQIENVELTHCGQAGGLGRYCSHTHMRSNTPGSYVRYNSIHHSFQRAVTVHATNHFTVKHNVAYNVLGHTIFVEDGVERFNVIEENLVAFSKPCYFCTDSDFKPANFWTASPTNFWRHNRAAGSTHFGFWFELPDSPLGPSASIANYCPSGEDLGEFRNNTAHSNSIGLRVYPIYRPAGGCGTVSKPQYFRNNTYFRNGEGTFHRNVGDIHHIDTRWVNNGHGFGWRFYKEMPYTFDPNIAHGLFVCNTAGPYCGSRALTMPQDEFWYMKNVTFVNYGNSGAIAGCHSCGSDEDYAQGGYTYRMEQLTFASSNVRTHWNTPKKCIYWDLDGTLTGFVNGSATPYYAYNSWPECPRDSVGTYQYGSVCNGSAIPRRIQIDYHEPRELDWVTMNITSNVGTDLVTFRPRDTYGWVIPMVNMHDYRLGFQGSLVDWRRHRTRYAEPPYIRPEEWTTLTWKWIDERYMNRVEYGTNKVIRNPVPFPELPDPTIHQFGTGSHPNSINRTWTVVLNAKNITDTNPKTQYQYTAWNIQCRPEGCNVPPPVNLGNATYWTDPISWTSGRKPGDGEHVVINASQHIIMDENPPKLGRLTILGKLEFRDNAYRRLEADAIIVWGELVIGTPDSPFANNADIILHGVRDSPVVILDNNLFLSNKVLAVLGRVSMVGTRRPLAWTRLATSAWPGNTTITLSQSVQDLWVAGDRISLSSTDYNPNEVEDATVTAVNGATVTLSAPLKFRHFAGNAASSGPGANVPLRAVVALLSRNIVVRANLTSADDTYGSHMVVSLIKRTDNDNKVTVRAGSADLRFVEFRNGGKMRTEHGAILFQYGNFLFDKSVPATNPTNYLEGVSFRDSFNYGVVAIAAKNIVVNASVFHRTYRSGLDVDQDSTGLRLVNSAFLGNYQSPDVNAADQIDWIVPQAAAYLNVLPAQFSGNVVGGAFDAGYVVRVADCNADHARLYSNNEAHSVRIGLHIMPSRSSTDGCVRVNGFRAWKASHIGILSVDQTSNLVISNSVVSDNHIGISLNFIKTSRTESYSKIQDTQVFGSTLASADCSRSTVCKAVGEFDGKGTTCGSVLGGFYRRAGILMPQYTNRAKTCDQDSTDLDVCRPPTMVAKKCALPWERRFGTIGTLNAAAYIDNVQFAYFNLSDCGNRSTAIVYNPTQVDFAVPHHLTRVTWNDVPLEARFDFRTNDEMTDEHCINGIGCDGMNNIHIRDVDGTATGTASTTITGPNPLNIFGQPRCVAHADWNGFECPGVKFIHGSVEAIDVGRVALGGMRITRRIDERDNSTWRVSMGFGSIKDMCAKRPAQPWYPHLVTPNINTDLFWPATEPGRVRYRFYSNNPSDAAVMSLFISRPHTWEAYVDNAPAPNLADVSNATYTRFPALNDPVGSFVYSPQRRRIWWTVRGTANGAGTYVDLVVKPTVQLNLHLAVSVEQFFGQDLVNNLAILLQIEPWRIKVVDVRPGSAQVTLEISDKNSTVVVDHANDTSTVAEALAQVERMQEIATKVATLATSGQFSQIGTYTVLAVAVTPPVNSLDAGSVGSTEPTVLIPGDGNRGKLSVGDLAGIIVGSIIGVVIIAGGLTAYRRMSRVRSSIMRHSSAAAVAPTPSGDEFSRYTNPISSPAATSARRPESARIHYQPTRIYHNPHAHV